MFCKLFVLAVALVAFVCAEPEPGYAYNSGLGYGARSYGYSGHGYAAPALAYGGYGAATYGRGFGLPYYAGRTIYG